MDNAQKAIMIGVGLFITIIIIAIVMVITGMGQELANNATGELSNMSSQLQKQLTQEYDGTTMTGSQVLAAIKRYHGQTDMIIILNNGKGSINYGGIKATKLSDSFEITGDVVNNDDINGKNTVGSLSDRTDSARYVVTTAKYRADLIKSGDAVMGIYFKKQ